MGSYNTPDLLKLSVADLGSDDLVRLYNRKYGGDAALSLANLEAWLAANATNDDLVTQYAAPSATSFSVTIAASNTWLILTPGAGYAAGTLVLPAGQDKAEILVNCTQSVAALTITPQSGQTVTGAPSALSANDSFRLRYDAQTSVWYSVT